MRWWLKNCLARDLLNGSQSNASRVQPMGVSQMAEPHYQNELSIYEKETLQKIEEFRNARSNWSTNTDVNQTIYTKVKEGLDETNIYKGRCLCLRRLRLKTTFLINHFKTLKPLRYYTLREKIPEYKKFDSEYEWKTQDELKPKTLEQTCSTRKLWTREGLEECFQDAFKTKDRKTRIKKEKECKKKGPSGPCKKVIRKLRKANIKGGIIESCKCEDGREVTVVIKGICLCDKGSLNNLNLNKVCDEYSKMAHKISGGPTTAVPPTTNRLEAQLNQNIQKSDAQVNKTAEPEKSTVLKTQEDNVNSENERKSGSEDEAKPEEEAKPEGVTEPEVATEPEVDTKNADLTKSELEISKQEDPEVNIREKGLIMFGNKSLFAIDSLEIHKKRRASANLKNETANNFYEKLEDDAPGARKRKISFKLEDLRPRNQEKSKINKSSGVTVLPKVTASGFVKTPKEELQSKNTGTDSLRNLPTDVTKESNVGKGEKGVSNEFNDTKSKNQSTVKQRFVGSSVSDGVGTLKSKTGIDNKLNDTEVLKNVTSKTSKNSKTELTRRSVGNGFLNREKDSLEFHKKQINQNDSSKISDKEKKIDILDSKSKINSKQEEEASLSEMSRRDNYESMISLYRNKPEEKSYMSLTKEELEKLKNKKM